MMEKLQQYKTSLMALGAVVVLYFGYIILVPDDITDDILLTDTNNIQGDVVGEATIVQLDRVRGINFRVGLFEEPLFTSLVDRAIEPFAEPKHRRDPFQPAGFGVNESGSIAEPLSIEQFVSGSFDEITDANEISEAEAGLFNLVPDEVEETDTTSASTSTDQATTTTQ